MGWGERMSSGAFLEPIHMSFFSVSAIAYFRLTVDLKLSSLSVSPSHSTSLPHSFPLLVPLPSFLHYADVWRFLKEH